MGTAQEIKMTGPGLDPYSGLGGGYGQYRQATAEASYRAAQESYLAQQQAVTGGLAYAGGVAAAGRTSAPPLEDAGISAGEIVAYRVWEFRNGFLHSMAARYVWLPGEVATGDLSLGLGVHAFKKAGDAIGQYGTDNIVLGRVLLWGEVIEHEKGYRAEFGVIDDILAVFPAKSWWKFWQRDRLTELRKLYGCRKEHQK